MAGPPLLLVPPPLLASVTPIYVSYNGRCGPDYGRCPGDQCCSLSGWCGGEKGISGAYCNYAGHGAGMGCMMAYNSPPPTPLVKGVD